MRSLRLIGLTILAMAILSVVAFADSSITFSNSGGQWNSTGSDGSTVLTLSSVAGDPSLLSGVSGLDSLGFGSLDCPQGSTMCAGSVSLNTGTGLISGHLNPAGSCPVSGCTPAVFNPGGHFMITSTAGGGFTFSGQFSSASWQKFTNSSGSFWTFVGQISSATLTLFPGTSQQQVFMISNAGTIDLTTIGNVVQTGTGLRWTNSGGATTFPSPVPEPGTLGLLGSGLMTLGFALKRKFANGTAESEKK